MRVSGGALKNRRIVVPKDSRPVSERVRKSCFDILSGEIAGRRILDLFAGSGALGIEALSRAARECVFIDSDNTALKIVKRNIETLGLQARAQVYLKDAFSALGDFFVRKEQFDIIFLDPPYYKQMLTKVLQELSQCDIVTPSGYLVAFCYIKDDYTAKSGNFFLKIKKEYGQTLFLIYMKK